MCDKNMIPLAPPSQEGMGEAFLAPQEGAALAPPCRRGWGRPPWRPPATSSPLASDAASLTPMRWAAFVVRVRLAAEAVALRLDGRRCRRRPPSACLAAIAAHARLSAVDTASLSSEAALATYCASRRLPWPRRHRSPRRRSRQRCSRPWPCLGPHSPRARA